MIKETIEKLLNRKNLSQKEAYDAMKAIMTGQLTAAQVSAFLVALRAKGETPEEIAGCALSMRDAAIPLTLRVNHVVDTCGTGGDGQGGLNVSTASAFVVAGAGLTVAKHGNRAISSRSGSADVLEAMGIKVDPPPAVIENEINTAGIGFMFAPNFHPAMKHAMPVRKELGFRTVFNLLGPLTNPAKASVQLIGVYKPELTVMLANVMKMMGHKAGLVVHSHGWDEITLDGPTDVSELLNGKVKSYRLTNKDFGLPKVSVKNLKSADAASSSGMITDILEGKKIPARNVVVANAAALIRIAAAAFDRKTISLKDAVKKAEASIDSGEALKKFRALAEISHSIE